MLVRVVDYAANPGGGCRFTGQLLRALRRVTSARYEIVSDARGARTYGALLGQEFAVRTVAPANALAARPPWMGRPGARLLNWMLRVPHFHLDVPARVFQGCDLVWLPWMQRHRIPWELSARVGATLHDVINVDFPGVLPEAFRRDEAETLRGWFASSARIIVDAKATVDAAERIFGKLAAPPRVVPLSSEHLDEVHSPRRTAWPFDGRPFLLCPTNASPHKNVDVLLEALASWGAHHPLVLTGSGTDLWSHESERHHTLRKLVERCGLVRDRDVFFLGYLEFNEYDALLRRARAVVIPTLAEGYGFPVVEAMYRGIPVLASDLPVLREMVDRTGGEILWFDPRSKDDLASKLALLDADYDDLRARAQAQVGSLISRSWDDVARDYAAILKLPLAEGRDFPPRRGVER